MARKHNQSEERLPPRQSDRSRSRGAVGPASIEGVEASDLPDKGRGNVESDPGRELRRHVPQNTGEVTGSDLNEDIGLAGHPEIREADDERFLGRHQGDK